MLRSKLICRSLRLQPRSCRRPRRAPGKHAFPSQRAFDLENEQKIYLVRVSRDLPRKEKKAVGPLL